MSAYVLLNLLNELGKSDKMRGLSSILKPFSHEFNKFNNICTRRPIQLYNINIINYYPFSQNIY